MDAKMTRNKLTDFQVFNDLFAGTIAESELTAHQSHKLERLKAIHGLLIKANSSRKIIKKMQKLYKLSETQILRDIQMTEQIFGAAGKSNKDYKRKVAEEMALETYRMARAKKDLRGMASANKNYIEATGCNIDDPELPDFEKMTPSPNIVIIPEAIMNKMAEKLNAGPVRWKPDNSQGDTTTDHEDLDTDADRAD